jgi:phosphoribosylformimino-5-aminoimidazole carboxamide ribonucleotide (ProFAR) isomerase
VVVSESGIRSASDVRALKEAGVNAVLVGEALMSAGDMGLKVRELAGLKEETGVRSQESDPHTAISGTTNNEN